MQEHNEKKNQIFRYILAFLPLCANVTVSSAFTIRLAVPLIGMIGELSVFGRRTGSPDSSDHQALISLLAVDEKETMLR